MAFKIDENSVEIQKYLLDSNPSHKTIVDAYVKRDMDLNFNTITVFEKAVDKLCLNLEGINRLIKYEFKRYVNAEIKKHLKNKNMTKRENLVFNYDKFYQENIKLLKYQKTLKRYNELLKFKESKDLKGFYSALSVDELSNLGF